MDPTVIAYGMSIYLGVLALTTFSDYGTWEIKTEALPPYLTDQGYTPAIFVNQVVDQIGLIRTETASQTQAEVLEGRAVKPVDEIASYFGVSGIIRAGQSSIGLAPPQIEVEILQRNDTTYWRMRGLHAVDGPLVETGTLRTDDPEQLIETIAHNAIAFSSPFEAAAHDLIADSRVGEYEKTIENTSDLLQACDGSRKAACSRSNIRAGYMIRGLAYLNQGKMLDALEDLRTANRTGHKDAVVTAFLGDVQRKLKNDQAAEARYVEALSLNAAVGDRFVRFGRGLAAAGNHPLAVERFETAARLDATTPVMLSSWSESLVSTGDFEAALEKLKEAEKLAEKPDLYGDRMAEIQEMIDGLEESRAKDKAAAEEAAKQDEAGAEDSADTEAPKAE